jgi:hypothetical protein
MIIYREVEKERTGNKLSPSNWSNYTSRVPGYSPDFVELKITERLCEVRRRLTRLRCRFTGNISLDEGETSASHSKLTNLRGQMVELHSGTSDRTAVIHVDRL